MPTAFIADFDVAEEMIKSYFNPQGRENGSTFF